MDLFQTVFATHLLPSSLQNSLTSKRITLQPSGFSWFLANPDGFVIFIFIISKDREKSIWSPVRFICTVWYIYPFHHSLPHPAIRGSLPLSPLFFMEASQTGLTDGLTDRPRDLSFYRDARELFAWQEFYVLQKRYGLTDKKTNQQSPNTYNISYNDGKELILLLWYLQRWYYRPTDRQTDGRTEGRTDTSSCGDTRRHLKTLALFPRNGWLFTSVCFEMRWMWQRYMEKTKEHIWLISNFHTVK